MSSGKSRNTPSQKASRHFQACPLERCSHYVHILLTGPGKGPSSSRMDSPSVLWLPLRKHPGNNGPLFSLLSPFPTAQCSSIHPSIHPSIQSSFLSSCARHCSRSWRDRGEVPSKALAFKLFTVSDLLSSAKVTVI